MWQRLLMSATSEALPMRRRHNSWKDSIPSPMCTGFLRLHCTASAPVHLHPPSSRMGTRFCRDRNPNRLRPCRRGGTLRSQCPPCEGGPPDTPQHTPRSQRRFPYRLRWRLAPSSFHHQRSQAPDHRAELDRLRPGAKYKEDPLRFPVHHRRSSRISLKNRCMPVGGASNRRFPGVPCPQEELCPFVAISRNVTKPISGCPAPAAPSSVPIATIPFSASISI